MTLAQTARISFDIQVEQAVTGDLTPGSGSPLLTRLQAANVIRAGTASGLGDLVYADSGTIVGSATTSLDLSGGGLLDPLGRTLVFAKLKLIAVHALSTNNIANNLEVTRPASNGVPWAKAAGDAVPLPPDGMFLWTAPGAGVVVTADTGDLLNLINAAATNTIGYDIVLIGTSA